MKLYSVAKGQRKYLEKVNDEAFAQKMMGDGVAIVPNEGKVYAPEDGVITMIFPTNHALGLTLDSGVEVLIHIGIDTVEMNGDGFQAFVKQGNQVHKGDLLIEFDLNKIIKAGYETDIMVIVTNTTSYSLIKATALQTVTQHDILLEIE